MFASRRTGLIIRYVRQVYRALLFKAAKPRIIALGDNNTIIEERNI